MNMLLRCLNANNMKCVLSVLFSFILIAASEHNENIQDITHDESANRYVGFEQHRLGPRYNLILLDQRLRADRHPTIGSQKNRFLNSYNGLGGYEEYGVLLAPGYNRGYGQRILDYNVNEWRQNLNYDKGKNLLLDYGINNNINNLGIYGLQNSPGYGINNVASGLNQNRDYNRGYGSYQNSDYNRGYGLYQNSDYNKGYGLYPNSDYNRGYGLYPNSDYNKGYGLYPNIDYNRGYGMYENRVPYRGNSGLQQQREYNIGYEVNENYENQRGLQQNRQYDRIYGRQQNQHNPLYYRLSAYN